MEMNGVQRIESGRIGAVQNDTNTAGSQVPGRRGPKMWPLSELRACSLSTFPTIPS